MGKHGWPGYDRGNGFFCVLGKRAFTPKGRLYQRRRPKLSSPNPLFNAGDIASLQTMKQEANQPSERQIRTVVDIAAPGSTIVSVKPLAGSYSNFTHLVEARSMNGSLTRLVVRRYAVFGDYDRGQKARREYKALELLQRRGVPVPEPLILDVTGDLLGIPGIVTAYTPGTHVESPADPEQWARALARTLARVHAIACAVANDDFLLDADAEASWFLRSPSPPDYMTAHAHGNEVWHLLRDAQAHVVPVPAVLVHLDYWPGNILWKGPKITAVVDWEEAACGDPTIDVAYCRMDMFLRGMNDTAELFLAAYEAETGRTVKNLGFWELAAAVRPMFSPDGWISEPLAAERFNRFIGGARTRLAAQL
jgi:aminoglycoside phosphotransferase (APT) family kinase protein